MPRKPTRPLHPLRMAEALDAMNVSAGAFAAKVHAFASILESGVQPSAAVAIGKDLGVAVETFRAAFWPEEE